MLHEEGLSSHFNILLGAPQSFLESQSALKTIAEFHCKRIICIYSRSKSDNMQSTNPLSTGFPSCANGWTSMKTFLCIFWYEKWCAVFRQWKRCYSPLSWCRVMYRQGWACQSRRGRLNSGLNSSWTGCEVLVSISGRKVGVSLSNSRTQIGRHFILCSLKHVWDRVLLYQHNKMITKGLA